MATKSGQIQIDLQVGFDKNAMNRAVEGVSQGMNDMARRTSQASRAVSRGTMSTFAGIGAALTASFAFGARAASQFEDEFANVKKTLDVSGTAEEVETKFANIAEQLRNISKFSPATVSELNQIAAVGGQLGIAADEIVKFTDTIQKLTVATNLGAEQAALSLARLQKITGLTSNDIDNLGSVIVKLGNNFATTESEIITAATQIATATAGTSTPFNNAAVDALAYATALRAIGQPAQAGSTAIIRLIQVVDRAVGSGGSGGNLSQIAETAKMTAEGFKELSAVDPNRAIAMFISGLGEAEKEGKDVVAILEDLGLGQIRSRRAILALSRAQQEQGGTTIPLLTASLNMANQEFVENTALLTEAERRYSTVISQIQILKNTVNEAGISFGSQFLPSLNNMVKGLTSIVTAGADLNKTIKRVGSLTSVFVILVRGVGMLRQTYQTLTKGLLEYQAAVNLAITGNMQLEATQRKLLFSSQQFRTGGLLYSRPSLGGLRNDVQGAGSRGILSLGSSEADRLQKQLGAAAFMQGPTQFGQKLIAPQVEGISRLRKSLTLLSPELREAIKVKNQLGIGIRELLRPAALLGNEFAGLTSRINTYNATAPAAIKMTATLQSGMIGLSLALKSVTTFFVGFLKGLTKIAALLGVFSFITKLIEESGAKLRGVEAFAEGAPALAENLLELEKAQGDLLSLRNILDKEKTKGADDEVVRAIEERISQIEQSITSKQNNIERASAQLLASLFPDLEQQIKSTAKALGKSPDIFTQEFLGGMSKLIVDFESGRLPTMNEVINASLDTRAAGKYSEKLKEIEKEIGVTNFAGDLFKTTEDFQDRVLGKVVKGAGSVFTKLFGSKEESIKLAKGTKETFLTIDLAMANTEAGYKKLQKEIQDDSVLSKILGDLTPEELAEFTSLTELFIDTISAATGVDSEDILGGATAYDRATSQLLKGREQLLMAQQRQLASVGLITNDQIIDVTESVSAFNKAQILVTDIIKDKFSSANLEIQDVRNEVGLSEDAFVSIFETIDNNLEETQSSFINLFSEIPDKILGSFEEFAFELFKKIDITKSFNLLVMELAEFAPLIANEFAKQGPAAMSQLEQALSNMPITLSLEAALERQALPEVKQQIQEALLAGDVESDAYEQAESIADGFIKGLDDNKERMAEIFRESIHLAFEAGDDEADTKSPSKRAAKQAADIVEGFVLEMEASDAKLYNAAKKAMSNVFRGFEDSTTPGAIAEAISPILRFAKTFSQAVSKTSEDFNIYKDFINSIRNLNTAQMQLVQTEQELNQVLRDRASVGERLARAQSNMDKLEITGAAGVITVNEEIGLLRQKISLQERIDKMNGKRSASELLTIQRAEENIQDLRAMASKGNISNLELQAAEEELAKLKGEDVSEDEKKLLILELANAEKELSDARENAVRISDDLVSAREEVIKIRDEQSLTEYKHQEALNAVEKAKMGLVDADLRLEESRGTVAQSIAADSAYMTNLSNLLGKYGLATSEIDTLILNHGSLSTMFQTPLTATFMDPVIEKYKEVARLQALAIYQNSMIGKALAGGYGVDEYRNFQDAKNSGLTSSTQQGTVYPDYKAQYDSLQNFFRQFDSFVNTGIVPGYGMGGRVKKYKYGGRGDPMTRALVGEYGPEEVKFIPGNGFMVKPLGTGKSGTVVNNLNVNVTGVPSDPISARKAAIQISKALNKLDKEGSSGTGLRRN